MLRNRFFTFVFLPTVAVCIIAFWIRGILLLDPDFGWHLRMGEIIQKTGIPKTDPFSYTMPSYPFVGHEWLTDIILAKLYPIIKAEGLAVIFSILATLALLIQMSLPIKKWSFVPFVLVAGSLLGFVGIRPQVISWIFFSILLLILFSSTDFTSKESFDPRLSSRRTRFAPFHLRGGFKRGWRFILPFLFFIWANLHGGFGMGIFVLFVVILLRMWEQKKIIIADAVLLSLCIGATLANPYGIHLWRELWTSLSDSSLRWSISEWRPGLFTFSFALWIFIAFSTMSVLRYRKRFALSQLVPYFILLIAGISSIRHMPFWLLMGFSMTTSAIVWFAEDVRRYKGGEKRLNKAYYIFASGAAIVVIIEAVLNLNGVKSLQEGSFYPKQAVEYLRAHKSCGQLFSTYGWGGYLIWKLPEKKVFIDGRMPSWRWVVNPPSESSYAFEEYNKVLGGEVPVKHVIAKYNIDTFLLPVENKKNIPPFLKKLQETLERLLKRQADGYGEFIKKLKDNGMVEVYKDETAVVYRGKDYQLQCDKTSYVNLSSTKLVLKERENNSTR